MNRSPQMPSNPMQGFMNGFQTFMQNRMQMMSQSQFGIPQDCMNDPDRIIQYLLDSGKINQAQYNQAKKTADQMKGNPAFQQFFKN